MRPKVHKTAVHKIRKIRKTAKAGSKRDAVPSDAAEAAAGKAVRKSRSSAKAEAAVAKNVRPRAGSARAEAAAEDRSVRKRVSNAKKAVKVSSVRAVTKLPRAEEEAVKAAKAGKAVPVDADADAMHRHQRIRHSLNLCAKTMRSRKSA